MTKFQKCVTIDIMLDRLGLKHRSYKLLSSSLTAKKVNLLYSALFDSDYVIDHYDGNFHGFYKKFATIGSPLDNNIITPYDD